MATKTIQIVSFLNDQISLSVEYSDVTNLISAFSYQNNTNKSAYVGFTTPTGVTTSKTLTAGETGKTTLPSTKRFLLTEGKDDFTTRIGVAP